MMGGREERSSPPLPRSICLTSLNYRVKMWAGPTLELVEVLRKEQFRIRRSTRLVFLNALLCSFSADIAELILHHYN